MWITNQLLGIIPGAVRTLLNPLNIFLSKPCYTTSHAASAEPTSSDGWSLTVTSMQVLK